MKTIYAIFGILILAFAFGLVAEQAIDKTEVQTCTELSREAREYSETYRKWQEEYPKQSQSDDEMCAVHGIKITTYPY